MGGALKIQPDAKTLKRGKMTMGGGEVDLRADFVTRQLRNERLAYAR
jgi:hypothetical protein